MRGCYLFFGLIDKKELALEDLAEGAFLAEETASGKTLGQE